MTRSDLGMFAQKVNVRPSAPIATTPAACDRGGAARAVMLLVPVRLVSSRGSDPRPACLPRIVCRIPPFGV